MNQWGKDILGIRNFEASYWIVFCDNNKIANYFWYSCPVFRRDIIASYTSQIVVVLCNFICSILAARMLGAKGQGDLALYSSFTGFVTLLIGMGLRRLLYILLQAKKLKKGKSSPC
jgi:hypothetical protein